MAVEIRKTKFFRGHRGVVLSTLRLQTLPKIVLSLTVFQKKHFPFAPKIQDGCQNFKKSKLFRGPRGVVLRSLRVTNLAEITLFHMVSR